MARSRHVYVVLDPLLTEPPVGGFSVKGEMVAWLLRARNKPYMGFDRLRVFRLDDGGYPGNITELSISELLASSG